VGGAKSKIGESEFFYESLFKIENYSLIHLYSVCIYNLSISSFIYRGKLSPF
jgi:hypothetical protein